MSRLSRRRFIGRMGAASAAWAAASWNVRSEAATQYRAAIIGSTGRGDYGHGFDVVFERFTNVRVVAVADSNEQGRARVAQKTRAPAQYADYRAMLEKEKPDLVVVAPRWSEQHHAMAMAALGVGAHVLSEKPFTVDLAEADEILALAAQKRRKVSVAHQMRLSPEIVRLRGTLQDGAIGELRQIRSWGKQDARAGGEDMLVLGTHIFDMMRLFAGDALACNAQVFHKGRAITRSDARQVTEQIGPVAGDEIEAQFEFAHGVTGTFTSRGRLRETLGHWSVELIGSKGAVRILMDIDPTVLQRQRTTVQPIGVRDEWLPLAEKTSGELRGFGPANDRVVRDWLESIEQDQTPQCSGVNGMKAIEMVMAVYHSALTRSQVALPLSVRKHPLT